MGVISLGSNNEFKSSRFIYSRVKRFLKSFDAANIIDEGEFPTYTKDVLNALGNGAYMESQAILEVKNRKAKLPDNFKYIYVAYKCSSLSGNIKQTTKHIQPSGFAFVTDVENDILETSSCKIDCCSSQTKLVESIRVQQYVLEEKRSDYEFGNIQSLQLSADVMPICAGDCPDMVNLSPYKITINDGYIYCNFSDDFIYLKYYGFPIDEEGEILIPDIEQIEKAIEWYIIWQILLSSWFNSTVPDIQNKFQYAESQYNKWFSAAKYITKLPSFAELVNTMRINRRNNTLVYLTQQYPNSNFQRSR